MDRRKAKIALDIGVGDEVIKRSGYPGVLGKLSNDWLADHTEGEKNCEMTSLHGVSSLR